MNSPAFSPFSSGFDPQRVDSDPGSPQRLAALTRSFAQRAAHYDVTGDFPHDNFAELHDAGLLRLALPARLGGNECDLATALRVITAVAKGDPSSALILTMHYLHSLRLRAASGWTAALQQQVAADIVKNGALINSLRVEPALGTPARGGLPATRATRTEKGWQLDGEKIYSTGSHGLSWLLVWGATDDPQPLTGSFLVPASASGVQIIDDWDHLGMRATCSHRVVFRQVTIPFDHAISLNERPAAQDAQETLWMSVLLPAVYDAVAQSAQQWLHDFLQHRIPSVLQAPLATLPRFQTLAGRIDTLLFSNQTLLHSAATGNIDPVRGGQLKHLITSQAIEAVELAIEAAGNPGLSRRSDLQRHLRNVLCARIHTPQDDVILQTAGQRVLAFSSNQQRSV